MLGELSTFDGVHTPIQSVERVNHYYRASKSAATLKAYRADLAAFSAYCRQTQQCPLPATPELIAGFLTSEADNGRKYATINRRLSAIAWAHREQRLESPTRDRLIREIMQGIGRKIGKSQDRKSALVAEHVRDYCRELLKRGDLLSLRNAAILLVGFGAALRRSELVALNVDDISFDDDGFLHINIRRSKTDQGGEGTVISIAPGETVSPSSVLKAYCNRAGVTNGPLFVGIGNRSRGNRVGARSVARIVKQAATSLGLCESDFSGHSLRAGFITSALANGAQIDRVQDVSRHSTVSILMSYAREADRKKRHAGDGLL